ncbi:MAG: hypothetical protein ACFE9T_03155 [Promethearchaeota archaeon]
MKSLTPITVVSGEALILLNMTISANGYQECYFETYIAVDPDIIDKETSKKKEIAIPGYNIILIIVLISVISVILIKKQMFK